ncbi:MAG: dihydrofolate reductase family protein [Candidatus Promineifilaceae bacterium]|nr:dihydrofolate reductase family protein [Candidatus Promineifilaceae bacterium]
MDLDIKFTVFIATSLDGYIARKNGDLDWLPGADGESDNDSNGEDYGYYDHWQAIDTLVLGRNSFDTVMSFGQWPYMGKRVVILSHGQPNVPEELRDKIEILSGTPQEIALRLAHTGSKHVYIDGGLTIQAFLRAGLIHELIVSVIPILIGQGIPLFGPLDYDIELQLLELKSFPNGIVQYKYRIDH